jgi:hypothetical protein
VGSTRSADYYIHAVEEGEPPGRWWGRGAEALGFARGQRVDREPYDLLFGERRGPDGVRLGRPPRFAEARERYREIRDQLLAGEPHATAEREAELRIEAAERPRLLRQQQTGALIRSLDSSARRDRTHVQPNPRR